MYYTNQTSCSKGKGIDMNNKITISAKRKEKGDSDHKIISVRMRDDLLQRLDSIAAQTNRSRNEVINLLLESAVEIVTVQE